MNTFCLRGAACSALRISLPIPSRYWLHQFVAGNLRPALPASIRNRPLVRSAFSTSAWSRSAVLMNPRADEEGKEMTIEISPRAVKRLREIQTEDANPNLALRITVESGGCHGFKYTISLSDKFDADEDTVFEEDGAKVVMDEPSLGLLKGSKIDYTMELIGSQFKVVDNPYATSSCGCGTSFDIKSYP